MRLSSAAIFVKISTALRYCPAVRYISPAARRSPSSSEDAACLRMRPWAMESSGTAIAPASVGSAPPAAVGLAGFGLARSPCWAQCLASFQFRSSVYISTARWYCLARPKHCAASLYLPWKAMTCAVTSCSSSCVRPVRLPYCCVMRFKRSMYRMSRIRMKDLRAMSNRRLCRASSASKRQSASVTPRHATLYAVSKSFFSMYLYSDALCGTSIVCIEM
mmetsp:Transcript_79571/g.257703  ORF Transcript_79571/g.257703 Transcript_79571/m.257703 type:complete len:219 (-) Transcript_79571:1625-2281(-)